MYYVLTKAAADRIERVFKDDAKIFMVYATIKANCESRISVTLEIQDGDLYSSLTLRKDIDFESVEENPLEGLTVKVVEVSNKVFWRQIIKRFSEDGFYFFMGSTFLLLAVAIAIAYFK